MIIVAILGKSGSGKSVLEGMLKEVGYNSIISYTTRPIRPGEQNHREYHFVTNDQFDSLLKNNRLVESAEYNGYRYGSPRPVGSTKNVIVLEMNGYLAYKNLYGEQVIGIYLKTPDNIIEDRLKSRGDTSDKIIESRKKLDSEAFSEAENIVDFTIDGSKSKAEVFCEALKIINSRR